MSALAFNFEEGGPPCIACGHSAGVHVTTGAVAEWAGGPWCEACDLDPDSTDDDDVVHHDYREVPA